MEVWQGWESVVLSDTYTQFNLAKKKKKLFSYAKNIIYITFIILACILYYFPHCDISFNPSHKLKKDSFQKQRKDNFIF